MGENKMTLRSLINLFTGHVDSGKSQIIEYISKLKIIDKEAGKITQSISAIPVPLSTITRLTQKTPGSFRVNLPGFLFIDSPGHAAFVNLRKRGGNLADMAVLVIDVNEGIMTQTKEAIEVLKEFKTPFVVALNKIDLLPGWRSTDRSLLENIQSQSQNIQQTLDKKLYEILGKLHELGIQSERFDRVRDYSKQVAIVPTSAKTGEGIPELLLVLLGIAQKFLESKLHTDVKKPGKSTILEIKEGRGDTCILDVILYDGRLSINDQIVIGSTEEPIITKIRSLNIIENKKPTQVREATAAANVQILTPVSREVLPGMPLYVANRDIEKVKEDIKKEIEEVVIETEKQGVIVKAESLGSLEAVTRLLTEKGIHIRKAALGSITKKDIIEAKTEKNEEYNAILGFNIKPIKSDIKIITSNIIYELVEKYEEWSKKKKQETESKKIDSLTKPTKIKILPGYVFRQSNPAVVGVEILSGSLSLHTDLMKNNGHPLTEVSGMQNDGKNIEKADKNTQVAIALPKITVGRQIMENEILYTDLKEDEAKELKDHKDLMTQDEIETLKEIVIIKRKKDPLWGI